MGATISPFQFPTRFRTWFRRASQRGGTFAPLPRRFRPVLGEWLEDRTAPAGGPLTFDSLGHVSATRVLANAGDLDLYSVQLDRGDTITASVAARTAEFRSGLASVLRIFDAAGTPLALDDRRGGDPKLNFQVTESGTYWLGVSSSPGADNLAANPLANHPGVSTGLYRLDIDRHTETVLQPDLAGSSFQVLSDTATVDEPVPISFLVGNRGGADPGDFQVQVLVSTSNLFLDSTSQVIWTSDRSTLIPDALGRWFSSSQIAVPLPKNLPPGPVYLGVRMVSDPNVPESDTTNNVTVHLGTDWRPLTIVSRVSAGQFDLSAIEPGLRTMATGTVDRGQTVTYTFTVNDDLDGGRFDAEIRQVTSDPLPRLTLAGLDGRTLIQTDAGRIAQHLTPGQYSLIVSAQTGPGNYRLATTFTEATVPSEPVIAGVSPGWPASGDVNNDGRDDLVIAHRVDQNVSVYLGNGDGTFQQPTSYPIESRMWKVNLADVNGDGNLDILTANKSTDAVGVLLGNGDGTFQPRVDYPVGTRVGGVTSADVNGDGFADLIASNYAADTVSILLGRGDGTFLPQYVYPTDKDGQFQGPGQARAADVNGDGIPDLVYPTYNGANVVIRLGLGGGVFGDERKNPTGLGSYNVEILDVNGDGQIDIVSGNAVADTVSVLLGNGDGSFQPTKNFAVGQNPFSIVAADFNGDGRPDFVTSNRGDNTVTVLLGNGDGTLQTKQVYTTGKTPRGVTVGDFNGDGFPDIATANQGDNTASILLGRGDGTFSSGTTQTPPAPSLRPHEVAIADLNGDGRPDIVTANRPDNSVSVLLSSAGGAFQPRQTFGTDRAPMSVAIGDFNGDGKPDLATANYEGSSSSVLLGNGDGTFQPTRNIPVGSAAYGVTIADIDGDGNDDILVANKNDNNVGVLVSNGDGTFQPMRINPVASGPYVIAVKDLNHDGKLDLTVSHFSSEVVDVLIGNGDGTFEPTRQFPVGSRPYGVAVADFNGDGHEDIVTANYRSSNSTVLLGSGDGNFGPPTIIPVGKAPNRVATADLNGDGIPDVITADYGSNAVSVLLGIGDGSFQPRRSFPAGSGPASVAVQDLDGDGLPDLVVGNRNVSNVNVLLGNGDGSFQLPTKFGTGKNRYATAIADVNGDGYPDLVKTSVRQGTVTLQLGSGTGAFGAGQSVAVGSAPTSTAVSDFNRDGRPDLVTTNSDDGTVSVLLGNGDGTFNIQQTFPVGRSPRRVATADLDGDGIADIVVSNYNDDTVSVLLGRGDGTFSAQQVTAVGSRPYALEVGDVNGDGRPDIVVANAASNTVSVLLGSGDGRFQVQHSAAVGQQPFAITLLDLDGDGNLDMATADAFDNTVSVFLGTGDGSFQIRESLTVGARPYSLVAVDVDGDGDPDLVTTNHGNATLSILLNVGGTLRLSPAISTDQLPTETLAADVNVDGRQDLVTIGNQDRANGVLLGRGDGTFQPATTATNVDLLNTPFLADLDGDAVPDRIVLDRSGQILFRRGLAGEAKSFAPPAVLNPGHPARDIAIVRTASGLVLAAADAQSDSTLSGTEFVFTVTLYSMSQDGTIARSTAFVTPALPVRLVAQDLTGDGLDDLIAANPLDDSVSIAIQRATGQFDDPLIRETGSVPSDIAVADVDGDSRPDILVSGQASGDVTILLNDPNYSFVQIHRIRGSLAVAGLSDTGAVRSPAQSVSLATGDFTGDGLVDVVLVNRGDHALTVLAGNGSGVFSDPSPARTTSTSDGANINARPGTVVVGDFNGDARSDLAILMEDTGQLWIYLGTGAGTFRHTTSIPVGDQATGLRVVQADNGRLDLLVGNGFGDVLRLEGRGDGTFQISGKRVSLSVIPDLLGSGLAGVLVGNQQDNRVTVQVQSAAGEGYSTVETLADGTGTQLAPGDVLWAKLRTQTTLPDPVVVSTGNNAVVVYRTTEVRNGVPVFAPNPRTYFVGTAPASATSADVNADGIPDLVIPNQGSNDVSVLFGSYFAGEWIGTSGPRLQSGGTGPLAVTVTDQTGDGIVDLVVTNGSSGTITVLHGVGRGFFDDRDPQLLFDLGDSLSQAPTFVGDTGLGYAVTTSGTLIRFELDKPGSATIIDAVQGVLTARTLPTGQLIVAYPGGGVSVLSPQGNTLVVTSELQSVGGVPVLPSAIEVVVQANGEYSVLVSSQGSDDIFTFNTGEPTSPPPVVPPPAVPPPVTTPTPEPTTPEPAQPLSPPPTSPPPTSVRARGPISVDGDVGLSSGAPTPGSGNSPGAGSGDSPSVGAVATSQLSTAGQVNGNSNTTVGQTATAAVTGASSGGTGGSAGAAGAASGGPSGGFSFSDAGVGTTNASAGLVAIQGSAYSTVAVLDFGALADDTSGDGHGRRPELSGRYPLGDTSPLHELLSGIDVALDEYQEQGAERIEESTGQSGRDPWSEDLFHQPARKPSEPEPIRETKQAVNFDPIPVFHAVDLDTWTVAVSDENVSGDGPQLHSRSVFRPVIAGTLFALGMFASLASFRVSGWLDTTRGNLHHPRLKSGEEPSE